MKKKIGGMWLAVGECEEAKKKFICHHRKIQYMYNHHTKHRECRLSYLDDYSDLILYTILTHGCYICTWIYFNIIHCAVFVLPLRVFYRCLYFVTVHCHKMVKINKFKESYRPQCICTKFFSLEIFFTSTTCVKITNLMSTHIGSGFGT